MSNKAMYADQFVARLVVLLPNVSIEQAQKWVNVARSENCVEGLVHPVAHAMGTKVGMIKEWRVRQLLKAFLVPENMNTLPALNSLITWCQDNYSWTTSCKNSGSVGEYWYVCKSLADYVSFGTPVRKIGERMTMRLAVLCKPL